MLVNARKMGDTLWILWQDLWLQKRCAERYTQKKTITPAMRQPGTAINARNTWCIIFKWNSLNIKLNRISKPLRLVLAVILLLEQHNTQLLSLHLEVGWQFFCQVCVENYMLNMTCRKLQNESLFILTESLPHIYTNGQKKMSPPLQYAVKAMVWYIVPIVI